MLYGFIADAGPTYAYVLYVGESRWTAIKHTLFVRALEIGDFVHGRTRMPAGTGTFEEIARCAPVLLRAWARQFPDRIASITYLAEAAGNAPELCDMLLQLTEHKDAVVREGAVYGLERIRARIHTRLCELAATDSSPGVRAAAADACDD